MTCKEFEKLIPDFVNKNMDFIMTKQFLEHLRSCPNCKEELNIQYLIEEGLVRLEDGSAFDLQKDMHELIREADKKVLFQEKFLKRGRVIESLVMIVVLVAVMVLILW